MSYEWLFGNHAVTRALEAGKRPVLEVRVTPAQKDRYAALAHKCKVKLAVVEKNILDDMTTQPHQGVAARVGGLPKNRLEDLGEASLLLALDQVTDPHNIGACVRSANAFGAAAVLVPSYKSGHDSAIVAKAASGAMEDTPIIEVGNLNAAIEKLKKMNFWVVGLDGEATQTLAEVDLGGKIVLVMGSEGQGLRRLVSENCDFMAKLPMVGNVESLNVSVATGISLYEVVRQRTTKKPRK